MNQERIVKWLVHASFILILIVSACGPALESDAPQRERMNPADDPSASSELPKDYAGSGDLRVMTADDMERLAEERSDAIARSSPLGEEHDELEAVRARVLRHARP